VLSHHLGDDQVNLVNSLHLAKARGVGIVSNKSYTHKGFTNLITVKLRTKREERLVSGTLLNGLGARIVQIDQFPVDFAPEGNIVLVSHHDKPGIIGRVGTILGSNDINIATMQVGRKLVGGEAIMVLTVDKSVPKDVLAEISRLPDLKNAKEIHV
jgi:D-3-phosphoglycerate dehydrogenase